MKFPHIFLTCGVMAMGLSTGSVSAAIYRLTAIEYSYHEAFVCGSRAVLTNGDAPTGVVRTYLLNDLTGSFVGAETALPGSIFWPWATPSQAPLITDYGFLSSNLVFLGGPPGTVHSNGVTVPFTQREVSLLISGETGMYTGLYHPWTAVCQVRFETPGLPAGSIFELNHNGGILFSRFTAELIPEPSITLSLASAFVFLLQRKRQ